MAALIGPLHSVVSGRLFFTISLRLSDAIFYFIFVFSSIRHLEVIYLIFLKIYGVYFKIRRSNVETRQICPKPLSLTMPSQTCAPSVPTQIQHVVSLLILLLPEYFICKRNACICFSRPLDADPSHHRYIIFGSITLTRI
jgi:hypothetical protein